MSCSSCARRRKAFARVLMNWSQRIANSGAAFTKPEASENWLQSPYLAKKGARKRSGR